MYNVPVIVQAVLKHLGHVNADAVVVDEEELHCHQKLQELYSSTKAAKVKMIIFSIFQGRLFFFFKKSN